MNGTARQRPVLDAGLDMTGPDISDEAANPRAARRPDRAHRWAHGDLVTLPPDTRWPLVVGILVELTSRRQVQRLRTDRGKGRAHSASHGAGGAGDA